MSTQTATRERPVIFSSEMIRAILAGRKTQTRRVVKPQPEHQPSLLEHSDRHRWSDGFDFIRTCPYGQPGDHLWCKETWSPDHRDFYPNFPIVYRANGEIRDSSYEPAGKTFSPELDAWFPFRWRSPMFMPRHASRITLEIAGVRVERLQEITEEDAKAEGVHCEIYRNPLVTFLPSSVFQQTWDSINAKRGFPWESNPWVWRIAFRRIDP